MPDTKNKNKNERIKNKKTLVKMMCKIIRIKDNNYNMLKMYISCIELYKCASIKKK